MIPLLISPCPCPLSPVSCVAPPLFPGVQIRRCVGQERLGRVAVQHRVAPVRQGRRRQGLHHRVSTARAVSLWTSRRTGGHGRDTASTPVHHHHVFTKLPPQHSHNHRTSTNTSTNTSTASTAVCNSKKNRPPSPPPCSHMAASHEQPNVSTFLPQRAHWPPRRRRLSVGWATLGVFFFRTKKRRKIQADASPVSINSPK